MIRINQSDDRMIRDRVKMKTFTRMMIVAVALFLLFLFMHFSVGNHNQDSVNSTSIEESVLTTTKRSVNRSADEVVICVVACGSEKLEEALTMLKSALVFARRPLHFIVIAEEKLIPMFEETLEDWKVLANKTFEFTVKPIAFPDISDASEWKKLFKPCAAQRLFLPTVLNDTDAVLYVDTDTLFLTGPEMVWDVFKYMNSTQFAALTPEHEDPNTGWYNRFAKHPYYGKLGVNSGVMLMNLTRMREFNWVQYVIPIHREYRQKLTWGDQDIINIIFHFHPERLFIYDCRFNYRPDHCMYMSVCPEAEKSGAIVIHGSRGSFHSKKQPPFTALYSAVQQYKLNTDPYENLLLPIKSYVTQETDSKCAKAWKAFIIRPELRFGKSDFSINYNQY